MADTRSRPHDDASRGAEARTGTDTAAQPRIGLREQAGRLASAFASALDTRLKLAALEFAEERERTRERLTLLLIAAVAAAFALLALNAMAVVLLWDRLGWISLALLAGLWLVVAAAAGAKLASVSRREQRPFEATLDAFERDRAWLAERFGRSEQR
jgi:uncharacterized membrane protein YqjE